MSTTLTDSDSSPVEVDSKGAIVVNYRKSSAKSSGSSHQYRKQRKDHGSSSTVSNQIDCNSLVFLSSQQCISAVTSKFDACKKKIVESIGFGGLLYLPDTTSHHKSFSLWLLRNLKWLTGALCLGENTNLVISPEHIGKVIGLNYSGIDVLDNAIESTAEKLAFIKSKLSFLHTQSDIVQAAQSYVEAASPENISQSYIDNFKVAFVIFAIGRFLAPGENAAEGNYDFWGALDEPEAINCYNWGVYVLSNMLESARKINWDIVYNRKIAPISCCTLILQIFYLDNIDFGTYNRAHNLFPRVKHYSSETMMRMIECCKIVDTSSTPSYGRIQTIRTSNTCYIIGTQPAITTAPSGLFPNPPMYPPPRSSSPKNTRKRTLEHTPSPNPYSSGHELPLVSSNGPSIEDDVMDVPSFLRGHYNGQFPPELLESISLHQAKCFQHVQSFSKALKAAISKENANFAMRIIQQANKNPGILALGNTHSPLPVRRIQYNDTPVRAEHSFAENSKHKTPRTTNTQSCKASKSSPANSCASFENEHTPQSEQFLLPQKYSSGKKPVQPECTRWYNCTESSKPNNKFQSPEASMKFVGTSQQFSPTTENRIFNGISLSARQINSMQSFDLNARSFAEQYSSSPIPKKKAGLGPLALSHWSLGLEELRADSSACATFFDWLSTTQRNQELDRLWIMHDTPRFIQIEGYQLRTEFVCNNGMSYSVFDLIIRRLKQLDKSIYSSTRPLRWRHMFESDFAMHALGDDHPCENIAVREQFTGSDVDYELCCCRMIFVPVLVNDLWWVYAFDMKSKSVVIMDPSGADEKNDNLIQIHFGTIETIKHHLTYSISTLFSGWNPSFERFKPIVFRTSGMPCRREQSGFFSLFFIANFEGTCLVSEPSQVNLQKFKEFLLYEILDLKGNTARTPSAYIHVLE